MSSQAFELWYYQSDSSKSIVHQFADIRWCIITITFNIGVLVYIISNI